MNFLNQSYMTAPTFNLKTWVLLLALASFTFSCIDQDFDEPPVPGLPDIDANTSIAELKARHTIGDDDQEITEDIIIRGIIVADDRSGNFFKNLILQDETGGIELRLNSTALYNNYPVGREVFVACKGLYIGDFNGVIQLNGSPGEAIEEVLIRDFVIPGQRDQTITPQVVTIDQLTEEMVSTLVTIEQVQFVEESVNKDFADAENRFSINHDLEDCNGNSIILRSSGFADFATELTPDGNGRITAIYSVFRDDKQLFIRDLSDINFEEPRCDGGSSNPPSGSEEYISLETLRTDFANGKSTIDANRKISGIVISDWQNQNTTGLNLVIQDAGIGIVVRFDEAHSFDLGNDVEIMVSGKTMSEFNGLLQVEDIELSAVTVLGTDNVPEPKEVSIQEILNNAEAWESTEVKISQVSITGGSVFSGALTVSDSTGSMTMFTRTAATFADTAVPTGTFDMTAVISQFNDPQLFIRNLADVGDVDSNNSGSNNNGNTALNEDFSGLTDGTDISLDGWMNIAVKGTRLWRAEEFSGNTFAQATAFMDTNDEMEAWLITPPINVDSANILTFRSAQAFYEHDGLSVWIAEDFNGSDVGSTNWTELTVTLASSNQANYDWVLSNEVDLSGFSGEVHIAFKYEGNKATDTTTYRIDDVKVQ